MKNLKIKFFFICFFTLALSFKTSAQTTHPNFIMHWLFTDATGTNIITNQEVCDCGTVYIKNKSTYNNGPSGGQGIGTTLDTGYYALYDPLGPGNFINIPAEDWLEDEVYAFTIPCGTNISKLRIKYWGPGTTPYLPNVHPSSSEHATLNITIHHISVDAGLDQTVCPFSAFTLNATGNGSIYSWSPSGGGNNPTLPIFASSTQTYTVTNSHNYNTTSQGVLTCSATDNVVVNILNAPSVNLPNYSLCDNSPLPVLNAPNPIGSSYTYQWNFTPSGSNTSSFLGTFQTVHTAFHGYGLYELTVIGANGCASTTTSNVVLDQSAGSNLNANFNHGTMNDYVNNVTHISANSNESGDHQWELYKSDINGTLISLLQTINNTSSVAFNPEPLSIFYKIVHRVKRAPCNQWVEHSSISYQTGFTLYPNPANINQKFSIELLDETQNGIIEIIDLSKGEIVYSNSIDYGVLHETSISVAGTYTVRLRTMNNEVISRTLIIQ